MKNSPHHRLLTPHSVSTRLYADNYEEFMRLCSEKTCKPADLLRDAFDEWLQMRRDAAGTSDVTQPGQEGSVEAKIDDLRQAIDQLTAKADEFIDKFDYVKRRDHGYLIEIFMAAYGARDLIWNHNISNTNNGKQTPESIQSKYQALQREWEAQAAALLDRVRETIRKGKKDAKAKPQSA
jgi:hypothetical protein